jgi:membrane associated rhomboid family serine protease
MPPVTRTLLIANVLLFLLQSFAEPLMVTYFALWPPTPPSVMGVPVQSYFLPWQLVTYSFLHGSGAHLFFNMLGLYMFGSELERVFGARRYTAYYFVCVIVAGLAQLLVAIASASPPYPTVGASGGVFGLLLAFGMYFPHRTVMLVIPPIPMPAWLFVGVFGMIELFLGVTGTQAGVAHFAHLGGMLGGYLLIRHWRSGRRR